MQGTYQDKELRQYEEWAEPRLASLPRWTREKQASRPRRSMQILGRLSLVLLVVQNSALVLTMHHSRTAPAESSPRYFVSTAVLLVELIKLVISLLITTYQMRKAHVSATVSELASLLYRSYFSADSWKLVIPATLYTLQNTLVYVALSNLDAVTFQVTYQLKVLTTVMFSILLLGRTVSPRQWLALFVLTFSVVIVQMSAPLSWKDLKSQIFSVFRMELLTGLDPVDPQERAVTDLNLATTLASPAKGIFAALAACITSGFTCVYFEKLVKDSLSTVSLWTRNVQLSTFSIFPALIIGVLWEDGTAIYREGFLYGYNASVWSTILLQAIGGIIVAVCITYADNVAKNFAAGMSTVVSAGMSWAIFGTAVSDTTAFGMALVLLATWLHQN